MGEPKTATGIERERAQQRGEMGRDMVASVDKTFEEIKRIWNGFIV